MRQGTNKSEGKQVDSSQEFVKSALDNEKILLVSKNWRKEIASKGTFLRKIIKSRFFNFIPQLFNMWLFLIIILAGFIAPQIGNENFAVVIVWILWWVALMIIMVPLLGRIWCQSCPLPIIGEWMQRKAILGVRNRKEFVGLNKRWPRALANMWLVNFIFLSLALFSGLLTTLPWVTSALFVGIIIIDLVISYVYRDRAFCLYLCPVGGFIGLYSNVSPVEIRVKDNTICKSHVPKTCVVGNENGYGCPWSRIPYRMERNTYCGLCMECIRTCPYDNMAINLRPPGTDLLVNKERGVDESFKSLIMLSCAILYSVVMMGPWGFIKSAANIDTWQAWGIYAAIFLFWALLAFPGIFLFFSWLSRVFSKTAEQLPSLKTYFVSYSYTLVPLGLIAWVAFTFGILFPNGSYIISVISDPFNQGWNLFGTGEFAWQPFLTGIVPYLQVAVMLFALYFSINMAQKIAGQLFPSDSSRAFASMVPIAVFHFLVVNALIILFVGQLI